MFRKHKVQLVTIIYMPIAFAVPIAIGILFPKQLLIFTKIGYLFAFFCAAAVFMPMGSRKIGKSEAKPKQSFVRWMLTIFIAEIGLGALFFMQNKIIIKTLFSNAVHRSFLYSNLEFFPWILFAIVAINFAFFSYKKSISSPFSAFIPLWPTVFAGRITKRIIDIYIKKATTFFIVINICFISLQLCYIFAPNAVKFNLLNGLIISGLLLIIYQNSFTQKLLKWLETKTIFQRTQFLFMMGFFIAAILTVNSFEPLLIKTLNYSFKMPVFLDLFFKSYTKTTMHLWNWIWWVLAVPSFCSLLIKISYGRKIRTFIIAVLLLPAVFIILMYAINDNVFLQSIMNNSVWLIYAILFLGFMFLNYLLSSKNSLDYFWLGFFPVEPLKKSRRASMRQYWLPAICVLGLLCMGAFKAVQLLTIVLVLPCFFIFICLSCVLKWRR